MIGKLKLLYSRTLKTKKTISIFFYLLILSFPFGANILHLSLGFLTIYPFLIFLLVLSLIGVFNYKIIKSKYEWYAILFILFWLIYALISTFFVAGLSAAKIDIRNLIGMLLTTFVIIWVKNYFGKKDFLVKVSWLFKLLFFFYLAVAIIEINTGIHFTGFFTRKLLHLPIGNVTYAPVFLYDNPNNFFVYLVLTGVIALIADAFTKKSRMFFLTVYISIFYVSLISSIRIGEIIGYLISILIIIYFIIHLRNKSFVRIYKPQLYAITLLIAFTILALISLPLYYGPLWHAKGGRGVNLPEIDNLNINNANNVKKVNNVNEYSTLIPMKDVPYLNKQKLNYHFTSVKERVSLFYNGLYMTKKSHFFGVGPGQYRYLSREGKKKYYTTTLISPHFWLMEILSQYGIVVLLGYLILLFLTTILIIKNYKRDIYSTGILIVGLLVFSLSSILPSSFLIININWIFMAIFIAVASELKYISNGATKT